MPALLPSQIFENFDFIEAGSQVTIPVDCIAIPLINIPGLTANEANDQTGDAREVIRCLTLAIADKWATIPAADRPAFMSITTPTLTAISATRVRKSITLSFDMDVPASDLQMPTEV